MTLKGNSGQKKVKLKWKSVKNANQRAITDLNAPNGSQDIPFQSQEFGQDGHRHFVGFRPHFHLNMTSQTQCCKTMKKWKCNISGVCCLICLKLCRILELSKGISLDFKFRCHGNQNQNDCLLLKKQKVYCLSKSDVQKVIWNNSLIVTAGSVKFWRKIGDTLYLLWEKNSLFFLKKANYSRLNCNSNEIWNQAKFLCSLLTACKIANKTDKRLLRYCTFILSMSCRIASVTSYLSENEAKHLQNDDIHLAPNPDFEMGYLENHLGH